MAEGAISQQEFDNAQAAAREAGAKWNADEQNALEEASKVDEAKAQLSAAKTVVEMARAQIKQAQTDVSAADLGLDGAEVRPAEANLEDVFVALSRAQAADDK